MTLIGYTMMCEQAGPKQPSMLLSCTLEKPDLIARPMLSARDHSRCQADAWPPRMRSAGVTGRILARRPRGCPAARRAHARPSPASTTK